MPPFALRLRLLPRFILVVVTVVTVVAAVLTVQATRRLSSTMHAAFASKGEALALSLAAAFEQSAGADSTGVQVAVDASKVIDGVRYIFVVDADGQTLSHTFSPAFPASAKDLNPVGIAELDARHPVKIAPEVELMTATGRLRVIDVAAPVAGGALGAVHVGMDRTLIESEVSELRGGMILWSVVVALLALLLGAAATYYSVVRPLRALHEVTARVVATGDLTVTLDHHGHDEIGELAASFSQMVARLRGIAASLHDDTKELRGAVARLEATIGEQNGMLTRQAAALQEAQVTTQEIRHTSQAAANAAEAMLREVAKAGDVGARGVEALEETERWLSAVRTRALEVSGNVAGLTTRAQQIGGITEAVKGLADQSNLLALNAAIEAARSGHHGSGFAVVAREIRALADQSVGATGRIGQVVRELTLAIGDAAQMANSSAGHMEEGLRAVHSSSVQLRELARLVKTNSDAVRQIAAAVGQQDAGVTQIFAAVSDLSSMMEGTVVQIDRGNNATDEVRRVSAHITTLVENYRI